MTDPETTNPDTDEPNWMLIQTLFGNLALGKTFTETARIATWPELKHRAEQNALRTFKYVKDMSAQTTMSEETRSELNSRLEDLKARLFALGVDV